MIFDEFKKKVDIHSTDLSRWPEQDMRAALELMSKSSEAKCYFDEALSFDDALRHAGHVGLKDTRALEQRVMRAISGVVQDAPEEALLSRLSGLKPAWLAAPGGGLVLAALVGFFIGFNPQHMEAQASDYLLDPVYYTESQIISGETDNYVLGQTRTEEEGEGR